MNISKIFVILALLAAGVFGYLVFISQQAETVNQQISVKQRQFNEAMYDVNKTKDTIASVEKETVEFTKLTEETTSLEARTKEVEAQTASFQSEAAEMEKKTQKLQSDMKQSVIAQRSLAKGEVIALLELKDGQQMKNIRIQEVKDHEVLLAFDSGLKRVSYDNLPSAIIDRFGITAETPPEEVASNAASVEDAALQKELNVKPLPKDPKVPLTQDQKKQIIASISQLENTLVKWNYQLGETRNRAARGDEGATATQKAMEAKIERLRAQIREYRRRMR
jgi:nitrogen fixation protein FixH